MSTKKGVITSSDSCFTISVPPTSSPSILSLSELASKQDSVSSSSPQYSSKWDSVLGGDVWGFFFLGPLGGVSSEVITFFPRTYLWYLSSKIPFIGNSTKSRLLLDDSVESKL